MMESNMVQHLHVFQLLMLNRQREYVDGKLPICTVIGFPNGYSTTAVKVFETKDAIENGASEIDMVINISS